MAGGLEIQIPYVDFSIKNKVPQRISITPTKVDVLKNLLYMSNKVKLTSSIQPLNTTENDIKWTIIDGSTYVSINSSTGELTIKDNAITQMVKVRAQSSSNASIYEDREIVVTYKEPIEIPEIKYDILVYDFYEQYVYFGPNAQYTVYAQLNPIINGKKVFADITKGAEYVNIISGNFDDNKTTIVFSFFEPNDEYVDIEFTFYYEDNPDIKKVVPIRLVTSVNNILFRNIDGGPYQTDTMYKFEFYTEPEITTRRLNIDLILGNEYIYQWYDTSVNGTTGWLNFVRKNVDIENDLNIVFKFSDPLSDISTNISFTFSDVPIHRINIYNNKESYTYNSNNDFYYNFSWQEQPNTFERTLSVNVLQTPNDIITWYKGDVSFGTGKFYFRPNSLTGAGDVSVRIYDPENILFAQDVLFKVQNPITMYTMLGFEKYKLHYENYIPNDSVIFTNTNGLVKDVYVDDETAPLNYIKTLITFVSKENNVEFDIIPNNINNQGGSYVDVPSAPEVEYFYNADRQNIYGGNGKVNRYIDIDYNNIADKPYEVYTTWKTVYHFFTKRNLVLNNFSSIGARSNKTQENYENLYRIQVSCTETGNGVTNTETHYTYMDPDDSYVTDYFDANNTKQLILNYRYNADNQRVTYTGSAVNFLTPLYQNNWILQGISDFAYYGKSPKTCYAIKKTPFAPNHNVGEFTPCINPGEVYNFKYTIEWKDNHEIYQVINIKFNIK